MAFRGENLGGEGKISRSMRRGNWKTDSDKSATPPTSEPFLIPDGPLPKRGAGVESKYASKQKVSPPPRKNRPPRVPSKPKQGNAVENEVSLEPVTVTSSSEEEISASVADIPESEEAELVISTEAEQKAVKNVSETPAIEKEVLVDGVDTLSSETASENTMDVAFTKIPPDQLKELEKLLKGKGGWARTLKPIIQGLQAAGFTVHIPKRGSAEKRDDTLKIYPLGSTKGLTYTTDEAVFLLKEVISNQRAKEIRRVLEKEVVKPVETPEDDGIPTLTDGVSEEELTTTTLPSTIEGEVVHNNTPVKNFELGDAGIEDAVILRETAKPNIGKSRERGDSVEAKREKDVPMRTDATKEITPLTTPETLSDEALRERAEKIAIMRAEILRREEDEGQAEGTSGSVKTETEMPPVNVDAEKPREEAPVAPERPRTFDERFALEFGVTKEMWEQIPLHEKLSPEQQKLVFENLREFNERDKTPYLSKVWEGAMEKIGRKKDVSPTLAVLTQLVESSALYGPKVHEENGELLTDFVGLDIPRESRKEWKQTFDALNAAAHRMSKTPASWQEDGIGTHSERESKMMAFMKNTFSPARKRYNEYQEIQKSYDAQKKELSRILGEAGYEPGVIAAKLVDIDKNVHMLQFQQTSPDAVEAIKDIPDTSMWKMIGKSLCNKSNLGYMAGGAAARAVLAGAMGVFVAPTVSAAIAGKRSWDKTAAEMRERDRAARMGKKDTSGEALNIVSAEMTIDIAGEKREVGATQKLQYLVDKYRALRETNDIEGLPSPQYIKDMNNLLESIRVRASYVEDKQRLNRINFGDKDERPVQMAKLYETLALAQMIVADNSHFPKIDEPIPDWRKGKKPKTLEERLASELSKNEDSIQNKRRSRQVKEASWHALRAGSFSAAGVWLASEVQEMGLGEKLKELLHTQNASGLSSLEMSFLSPEEVEGGISSYPEDTPMMSQRPPYTIRSGDTLTKIMREQMPEIQALDAGKAQNTAIAKILKGLSPEELQRIGIRSGNPDLIYAGETINTEALHKIVVSHQSVIDEVASRASSVAKTAHEAVGEKASGELLTPKPLNVEPQTIEVPKVVPVEAGELGTVSKYEYRVGVPNAGEDPNLRLSILNEATQHTERWMKLYPYASARDAVKAGIMEGHFKNLFGEQWASAGKARVTDVLTHGSRFSVGNSDRMMSEFRTLVETVEKPPMNVVPMPAENMKEYLERASMAYVLRGNGIPENNLIRKIEMYYVKK